MLFVSHDRYFINRTATRILNLTEQKIVNYIGNYDYYLEKKETNERANKVRSTPVAVSTAREISLAPVNKLIDDIVKANAG